MQWIIRSNNVNKRYTFVYMQENKKETILRISKRKEPPPGSIIWPLCTGIITGSGKSSFSIKADYVCFHFVARGRGILRANHSGKSLVLNAGDMFCLWPGVFTEYRKVAEDPWRVYWIHLAGMGAGGFARECGFNRDQIHLRPQEPQQALHVFKTLFGYMESDCKISPYSIVGKLYLLAPACLHTAGLREKNSGGTDDSLVDKIDTILETPSSLQLNVSELAEILGISRVKLFLLFKKYYKTSPSMYLNNLKLKKAKELLANTDVTISEIASLAGFSNNKYFYRSFQRSTGFTPGKWRTQNRT